METIYEKINKSDMSEFAKLVYVEVARIPKGKVATYADIARAIGHPGAARAVGNAIHCNPFAPEVPCHRVIRSNGQIGGFAWGEEKKIKMLIKDGVEIMRSKVNRDFISK